MVTYYTPALYGSSPSVGYELKHYIENGICYMNVRLVYGAKGNKFGGYRLYYSFEFAGAYTGSIGTNGTKYFETASVSVENSTGVAYSDAAAGYISNYEGYSFSFPVTKDESYEVWDGTGSTLTFRIWRSGGSSSSTGHMTSALSTGQVPWTNATIYCRGDGYTSVDVEFSTGEKYVVTPESVTASGDTNAITICGITGGSVTVTGNITGNYEFAQWVKREGRSLSNSSVTYHAENPYSFDVIADRDHKFILRPESAKKAGVAHIYDGDEWKQATAYIYTGEEWQTVRPNIYNGTEWKG